MKNLRILKKYCRLFVKKWIRSKNMSISSLAQVTYSSTSTITRFCHKLGLDGYKKFQILFNSEYEAYAKMV